MPPKVKFTKDEVIEAAFEVVEESGLGNLTARRVAGKLGSSTAPVYRHFTAMEQLALEVIKRTQRLLLEYTTIPYTDRVFLNMGTGVAMFACEHGRLYRVLLLEGSKYRDVVNEFLEILEGELTRDQRFTCLSREERHTLLHKMWTFTHGLASLICVGIIEDCSQEFIINTLLEMGTDVIGATMAKHSMSKTQNN